jgi:hypothetical protein
MPNPLVKIARGQILRLLDGQRVQVPTSVGLLEVEAKSDNHWQPLKRLPPSTVDQMRANHERLGMRELPDAIWSNDIYEVIVYWNEEGGAHLSIKRYDRAAVRNWRHLQQIKNEVCGEFREALELFPSEHRIADNANQMHLWVMPEGMLIPVGFDSGFVTIRDEDVEAYNAAGGPGRQEPMQPGLTVGQKMQTEQDNRGLSPAEIMARGVNRRG